MTGVALGAVFLRMPMPPPALRVVCFRLPFRAVFFLDFANFLTSPR